MCKELLGVIESSILAKITANDIIEIIEKYHTK